MKLVFLLLLSLLLACGSKNKVNIKISPKEIIQGDNVDILISGLKPFSEYKIVLQSIFDKKSNCYSEAFYVSNNKGEIDIDNFESVGGDFYGKDSLGLFYNIYARDEAPEYLLIKNRKEILPKKQQNFIQIVKDDNLIAKQSFELSILSKKVNHIKIREKGIKADLFLANKTKNLLMVFGGSEGDNEVSSFLAQVLASKGYNTCAISYFFAEGQQKKMTNIPLETIDKTLISVKREMGGIEELYIHGSSKGAELALLYASLNSTVNGVIAVSPSSVVLQSFNKSPHSTWTYKGKEVEYMQFNYDGKLKLDKYNRKIYAHYYFPFLEKVKDDAKIKVENIEGDIILFSGKDDLLWPSSYMADMISDRISENKNSFIFKNYQYENVGHYFYVPYLPTYWEKHYATGGIEKDNAYAQLDAWNKLLQYLESKSIRN